MVSLDINYLEGIGKAIENLDRYLAVSREEFLDDEMRQHAVAYQLCLWAHWVKLLGNNFSSQHPRLDFQDTWAMALKPDWKDIWDLCEMLPSLKAELDEVIKLVQA